MSSIGALFPSSYVARPNVVRTALQLGARAGLALGIVACGADTRPPYVGDRAGDGDSQRDAAVEDELITAPPSATGGGACETIVEVPIVKPNFYFVLDASGSMIEPLPGETVSRYKSATASIENMLSGVQTRVNFGAALFPNPLHGASCSPGAEVFGLRNTQNAKPDKALKGLLATLTQYIPEGGSPVSSTLSAIRPTLLTLSGPTYVFLLSDGAPNCNLTVGCDVNACIPNIEKMSFAGGITCDDTTNCCQPGWLEHLCLDEDATNGELATLAKADIPTYVIGLPGSETYADVLGRMARAGGTARQGEERLYYQVNDAPDLAATLIELGREILFDCDIALNFAPTAPELLHVYAGDTEIPTERWRLTDETAIELLGETCEQWKKGELPEVRVRQTCTSPVR